VGQDDSGRPRRFRHRGPTDPDFFSTARSFPTSIGPLVRPGEVWSYYVDLRFKAESTSWPPSWLQAWERQFHVATAQWGLGCYDRFLMGEGEEWLAAAAAAGDYLLERQRVDGAWVHGILMRHTYLLEPPWVSAMAQGEGASLLVRLHRETGEERYADAAIKALGPLRLPTSEGGTRAMLDGGPFFEEYPTDPPSFVLNGGFFALWGCYDVGQGLDDGRASEDFADGIEALAGNIERWDTGYWSLYDLFPHPVPNIASSAYHGLHTTQLRAMQLIAPRSELEQAASRFRDYAQSPRNRSRAFARKALFRVVVPRNQLLAHRLPWSETQHQRRIGSRRMHRSLVLCFHAVSPRWQSALAVSPEQFRDQLELLLRQGYEAVTFSQVVQGDVPAKPLAITFDDAFRSVHRNAWPILRELGLSATVFAPSALIGGRGPMSWPGIERWVGTPDEEELVPMGWDELRQLRDDGWEIASHGRVHLRLTELSEEELVSELVDSRQTCTREIAMPCLTFAYPYGAHDQRVREAAREAGYLAAATMRPANGDAYSWPRIGIYPVDRSWRFRLKTSPTVRRVRSWRPTQSLERARRLGGQAT
jgi:peptidoglycan/xylan/chitin deacetylase (PgdA/CDA1 family)